MTKRVHADGWILRAALVVLVVSVIWFGVSERQSEGVRKVSRLALSGVAHTGVEWEERAPTTFVWDVPQPQSRGDGWIYGVFTPPEIWFDGRSGELRVAGRNEFSETSEGVAEMGTVETFGIELVSVRRELFRIQLVGFAGAGAEARGIFENRETGEVVVAGAGDGFPRQGFVVESFSLQRREVQLPESMRVPRTVAVAVIRDERIGARIELTSNERTLGSGLIARVIAGEMEEIREVRTGETITVDDVAYRIERVQEDPPLIEVTRVAEVEATERRVVLFMNRETDAHGALPSI